MAQKKTANAASANGADAGTRGVASRAKKARKKRTARRGRAKEATPVASGRRRGPGRPKLGKSAALAGKRTKRGTRYTDTERQRILDTAAREKLTGTQVAKRFGVTTVTYYLWRKKAKAVARRGPKSVRPKVNGLMDGLNLESLVREQVRARIRELVPQEVDRLLKDVL